MRMIYLLLVMMTSSLWASDTILLTNDREGKSVYDSSSSEKRIKKLLHHLAPSELKNAFKNSLNELKDKKLCAYTLNESLSEKLSPVSKHFNLKSTVLYLREQNLIDDVVVRILLRAHEVQTTLIKVRAEDEVLYPVKTKKREELLKIVASFENRFLKNSCLDEAYRSFISEIRKVEKHIKDPDLEELFLAAKNQNRLNEETYTILEKARLNGLDQAGLGLASYYQKITMLRTQYPLRDPNEQSEFVTKKIKKIKLSRRQKLYESYTDLQIILMANLIKNLRQDLESPKMEILITTKEGEIKRRELKPMERFRASIRFLRVEMANLSLNTYFAGRSPEFLDLVVAAYEIGLIPASEVDALASMEEIWNPKKTFMEKASVWINTFGTIATIVIPPPYGFIPAIALVIIEATSKKTKNTNEIDPTSVF